jgi:hypothetical protein
MLGRSNNAMGIQSDVPGMKRGTLRPYFTVHWGDLSGVAGRAYGTFTFSDVHSCVSFASLPMSKRPPSQQQEYARSESWRPLFQLDAARRLLSSPHYFNKASFINHEDLHLHHNPTSK